MRLIDADRLINILEPTRDCFLTDGEGAIRLINDAPTIELDDCVSREAVKYYIEAHINEIITESGIDKNAHTNRVLRALVKGVETMPTAKPKGKK